MKNFYLITLFMCLSNLQAWATGSSEKAVYDLIERVTPGYASQYRLEIISSENGNDIYEVDGDGQKIILRGNNAVSLATAFNWYLKYTCHAHVSWFGNQLELPAKLPQPAHKERRIINGKYRVYMNYCTVSYTAAWWNHTGGPGAVPAPYRDSRFR